MTQASRVDAVLRVSEHVLHTRDDAGPRGTTDPQVPIRRAVVVVVVLTAGMHRESLPHATATTAATTQAACEMKGRAPHPEGENNPARAPVGGAAPRPALPPNQEEDLMI